MRYYISSPPMNPLSRAFAVLLGALSLIGFFFFGLIVLAVLLLVFVVFAGAVWIRSRWLGRNTPGSPAPGEDSNSPGNVIDAEYTVVSRRHE